jgi:hypothetical protein
MKTYTKSKKPSAWAEEFQEDETHERLSRTERWVMQERVISRVGYFQKIQGMLCSFRGLKLPNFIFITRIN